MPLFIISVFSDVSILAVDDESNWRFGWLAKKWPKINFRSLSLSVDEFSFKFCVYTLVFLF